MTHRSGDDLTRRAEEVEVLAVVARARVEHVEDAKDVVS